MMHGGGRRRPQRRGNTGHSGREERPRYVVPSDTLRAVGNPVSQISNLSLLLQKYAPFMKEKGAHKATVSMLNRLGFRPRLEGVIEDYATYLNSYLAVISRTGRTFVLKTRERLIAGLGDESVYETGIRLLRNYGVPYIPGSALKGVAKAWAIEMMAELLDGCERFPGDFFSRAGKVQKLLNEGKAEEFPAGVKLTSPSRHLKELLEALGIGAEPGSVVNAREIAEELVKVFGTINEESSAVFFDALPSPVKEPLEKERLITQLRGNMKGAIEFDIMNPHYGPYYQGRDSPGDWHSPVPVLFLTVRKGVPFVFAVGGGKAGTAEKLLKLALRNHGVGAKTSLGYGRFS